MESQTATLPPLPGSDQQSLDWNKKDHFYGVGAREFWGENQIVREVVKPYEKCNHYFMKNTDTVRCQKCHFGLTGTGLKTQDGKLFLGGEPVEF